MMIFSTIKNIKTKVIVDCSHGNSGKSYKNQPLVVESIMNQIHHYETNICGVMIESNLICAGKRNPRAF
jgi:3-deoxy-7-phosphoheptulonate synthase